MNNQSDNVNYDNYFNLDLDTIYRVEIAVYYSFHSTLYLHYVSLSDPPNEFYLIFHDVAFFDSLFQMEGNVIFQLAREKETKQFLKNRIIMPSSKTLDDYKMFYSSSLNTPIRIISIGAEITNRVHPIIKQAQKL